MKFKFKPEKSNKLLMISILILLLFTCVVWLMLREYIYFTIYIILTILISFMYFGTVYYINEDKLVTRLGFIKIKISFKKIRSVDNLNDKVRINLKNYFINVYPQNKDIFVAKLNSKLTNKNSYNIIDKK